MTVESTHTIAAIGDHLENGGIIIMSGDALRNGDIDFAMAANHVTAEKINFMARYGRGLICLGITAERAWKLGITPQNSGNENSSGRPFGCSIEAKLGVDTGISAFDRAHTIAVATAADARASDIVSPGHVFPLIAEPGGLASRRSTLEAGIDLCRKFNLGEGIVLCAIMRDDGSMARAEDMQLFSKEHDIPIVDIGTMVDG